VLVLLMGIPVVALIIAGMARDVVRQGKMLLLVFAVMILITVLTVRTGETYSLAGVGLATYDGLLAGGPEGCCLRYAQALLLRRQAGLAREGGGEETAASLLRIAEKELKSVESDSACARLAGQARKGARP
jgi:hypothetical protein